MADTVREQLRRHADSDSVAIRYDDTSITWRDYLAGADARAGAVTGMLDPARPLHVATLLENTPEMLFALAAGAAGGYVTVGLNATRRGRGWPVTSARRSARSSSPTPSSSRCWTASTWARSA